MTKPGVDWTEIERQVKAGVSMRELERQHNITHQSISERCARQGWIKSDLVKDIPKELRDTETVKQYVTPKTHGQKLIRKRSPRRMMDVLRVIRQGASITTAAAYVGISPGTLSNWMKDDPKFKELAKQCEMAGYAEDELSIVKARNRGDWKAAEARLKRAKNPEIKEKWGDSGEKSGGITVNISVPSPLAPPTIDITPKE